MKYPRAAGSIVQVSHHCFCCCYEKWVIVGQEIRAFWQLLWSYLKSELQWRMFHWSTIEGSRELSKLKDIDWRFHFTFTAVFWYMYCD